MTDTEAAGLRLALYARVSTEEQREGNTIDSQIAELERFSREKAWIVGGVYKDDGWSGGVMERPDLDRLRDDARKGLFQAVLINDVDRLARDVAHLGVIKRDLEKQGVRVIFRKLPSDASPTHNLMVNILGSFAEFERELIADRVRRGRRHAVEVRKQYLSSHTAYGFHYTPKDRAAGKGGFLEVMTAEAQVVRQMFEWVDCDGLSARRVLVRLNERRIPSRKGAPWCKSSVLRMLHNEMYAGVWHYNKFQGCEPQTRKTNVPYRRRLKTSVRMRPREEWLPLQLPENLILVRRDRWERVQERLRRNMSFSPRNEKHFYLLKGLVWCGECGARYVGSPCHGKYYYRCIARCRQQPSVTEHILDDAAISAVERVLTNPALVLDQVERLNKAATEATKQQLNSAIEAEKELRQIRTEETRLIEGYRTEVITAAQLGMELEKLKARRSVAETRRREAGADQPPVSFPLVKKSVEDYCAEAMRSLHSLDPEALRELLRTVIRKIVFKGRAMRIQGHLPVNPTIALDLAEPVALRHCAH